MDSQIGQIIHSFMYQFVHYCILRFFCFGSWTFYFILNDRNNIFCYIFPPARQNAIYFNSYHANKLSQKKRLLF